MPLIAGVVAQAVVAVFQSLFAESLLAPFGKGHLAPLDFLFMLLIVSLCLAIGVTVYRVTLRPWLQGLRFPHTLRLLLGGFALTLILVMLFWFLEYIFEAPPQTGTLLLGTAIIVGIYLLYATVVWLRARRPATR